MMNQKSKTKDNKTTIKTKKRPKTDYDEDLRKGQRQGLGAWCCFSELWNYFFAPSDKGKKGTKIVVIMNVNKYNNKATPLPLNLSDNFQ